MPVKPDLLNQCETVYFLEAGAPDAADQVILRQGIVDSTFEQGSPTPTIDVALSDEPRIPAMRLEDLFSERTVIKAILERRETLRAINPNHFYMDEVVEDPASRQELTAMLASMRQERGLSGVPQKAAAGTVA